MYLLTLNYCPVLCTGCTGEHSVTRPARRVQEASQRASPYWRRGESLTRGNLPGAHYRLS